MTYGYQIVELQTRRVVDEVCSCAMAHQLEREYAAEGLDVEVVPVCSGEPDDEQLVSELVRS